MTTYKPDLRQTYSNHAEERNHDFIADWKAVEREAFLNRLRSEGAESLLEIGAGPGRDSEFFQRSGLRVVCTDLSPEMVRICRDKGLEAHEMDFYELDFPEASFDAVFAMNCLLHVPKSELQGVLLGIARLLKPDGLLFMGVYGGPDSEGMWENDHYEPKRFFAMYADGALQEAVSAVFRIEEFHTVSQGEGQPHFQSLTLRPKSQEHTAS